MGIRIQDKLFSLETGNTMYQMKVDETGLLQHLYYGIKTADDMSYLIRRADRCGSNNPYEKQNDRTYSVPIPMARSSHDSLKQDSVFPKQFICLPTASKSRATMQRSVHSSATHHSMRYATRKTST